MPMSVGPQGVSVAGTENASVSAGGAAALGVGYRRPMGHNRGEFRTTWRGEVVSSEGFRVGIPSRTELSYAYDGGRLVLPCEVMSGSPFEVAVFTLGVPDSPDRPLWKILENIRRAFEYAGWSLVVQ